MGRSTRTAKLAAGGAPVVNAAIVAGEAVLRGDVILQGADGKGYVAAMPTASAVALAVRPPAGGPQADNIQIASSVAAKVAQNGGGNDMYEVIKLSSGNIALVWFDTTAAKIKATVYNQDGGVVVPETALTGPVAHPGKNVSAVALKDGGFAVGYINAITGVPSPNTTGLATYDNTCNLTLMPVVTDTTTTASAVRIAQLANGNIVSISTVGTSARFAIYTLAGAQVKAATQFYAAAATSTGSRTFGVAAAVGGTFAISWMSSTGSNSTCNLQVFSAAGATIGANVQIFAVGSSSDGYVQIVGLAGGNFAVAAYTNSAGLFLAIVDPAGALQGKIDLGRLTYETQANQANLAAMPNGDVVVAFNGAGGLSVARYAANASVVVAPMVLDVAGSSANVSAAPDNSAIVIASNGGTVSTYALSAALALAYPVASFALSTSYPRLHALTVASTLYTLPSYMLIYQASGSGNPITLATKFWRRQALTLVGVANNAPAKDAPLSIQVSGQASLRVPFSQPWSTNQQGTVPPGQKMNVVGNTAMLQGIQAATSYPLN